MSELELVYHMGANERGVERKTDNFQQGPFSHLGAVSVRQARGGMTSEMTRSVPPPKHDQTHGGFTRSVSTILSNILGVSQLGSCICRDGFVSSFQTSLWRDGWFTMTSLGLCRTLLQRALEKTLLESLISKLGLMTRQYFREARNRLRQDSLGELWRR
ncbi:hypothetical protein DY000_02039185 [Brassica cretica]|uniref:Uncharacterized protein n=1 Tax=Brassica cretica TaxID=69181 RepID=A0ABQ7BRI8_BRACR|nr:hypothetical protein DY000_02039185 [Brassica cretica]